MTSAHFGQRMFIETVLRATYSRGYPFCAMAKCGGVLSRSLGTFRGILARSKWKEGSDQINFKFPSKSLGNGQYKASVFGYPAEHKAGVQDNFTFKLQKSK